jgi:hypothetical protein
MSTEELALAWSTCFSIRAVWRTAHVFTLGSETPSSMLNSASGRESKIGASRPEWKRGELGGWPDEQFIDATIYGPPTA